MTTGPPGPARIAGRWHAGRKCLDKCPIGRCAGCRDDQGMSRAVTTHAVPAGRPARPGERAACAPPWTRCPGGPGDDPAGPDARPGDGRMPGRPRLHSAAATGAARSVVTGRPRRRRGCRPGRGAGEPWPLAATTTRCSVCRPMRTPRSSRTHSASWPAATTRTSAPSRGEDGKGGGVVPVVQDVHRR